MLLAAQGRTAEAEAEINDALQYRASGEFHHASVLVAAAYALMDRHDEALHWLEWTIRDGFPCYPLIARSHHFSSLRDDARFTRLLDELRAEWESYGAGLFPDRP